jgi:hypothetical protein
LRVVRHALPPGHRREDVAAERAGQRQEPACDPCPEPQTAELHNALGVARASAGCEDGRATVEAARQAVASDPGNLVAALNLVEGRCAPVPGRSYVT